MHDELHAEHIEIEGHGGDAVQTYLATPLDPAPTGGVIVIHHMPGFDRSSKEITRTFAARGYLAACPNLYWREAPGAEPDDAAATARANGGVPDDRLVGDVAGAATYLRAHPSSNGKVGVIGYCSGGRQSVLAACSLELDAAVDCYGGGVVVGADQLTPERPVAVIDMTKDLHCPMLGLFGAEDANPSPEHVARMEEEMKKHAKSYDFHSYEGAGHGFFWVERPMYNAEAARDGWHQIWDFYGKHLAG